MNTDINNLTQHIPEYEDTKTIDFGQLKRDASQPQLAQFRTSEGIERLRGYSRGSNWENELEKRKQVMQQQKQSRNRFP